MASILSAGNGTKKSIKLVLILTSSYFVIQIIAGVKIGSLAVISDAGHMLIDVAGLVMALLAISFTQKPATPTRTYGFYRGEILASLLNSIFLILLSVFILIEGFQRIIHPAPVSGLPMIIVASIGLAINLVGVRVLGRTRVNRKRLQQDYERDYYNKVKEQVAEENLNVHGAYLEVFADSIGSAGVIVAGIIIYISGFYLADPLISIGIVALIIPRTWLLLKKAIHILIEGTPIHLCHEEIKNSILKVRGVTGVFDLHIWTISSGIHALSAHVVIIDNKKSSDILQEINSILEKGYDITHATIQVESYHESGNI
ncbi:MAG TPA: cation diffusion facilitator family transporter [Nitrososphaeraceae archaeon]|nr:cation diffusion facilitator family transporter [Nitrososphaeraceae archaeon]